MALNIKKQRVCNLAREAAERFNTTQVEVIEKALQKLLHSEEQRRKERYERTMAAVDAIHASTTDEVATVEAELKLIFERYLHESPDGSWHVDVQAVRADGAPEAELRRIANGFNSVLGKAVFPEGDDNGSGGRGVNPEYAFGSRAWAVCTLDYVVPGAGEDLLGGGVYAWLKKGKYAKVASFLLRAVAPRMLLGGGVGLAVNLAVGASWCWLGKN
ncbi:MAG: type II toxin-antitoxin system VapB family antitoxin [Propionibacteriaceae bacterium]|jgi:rv0623-like transcription factor|nr:type II toxin-antitoxin system VapB family antitoxin [Propionibacteriaceae bacterium]